MTRYLTSNNTATGFNNGLFCPGRNELINVTRVDITDGVGLESTYHRRMKITTDLADEIHGVYGAYPLAGILSLTNGGDFLDLYDLIGRDSGFGIVGNFDVQDLFILRVNSNNVNDSLPGLTGVTFTYHTPSFFNKIKALNAATITVFDRNNPVALSAGVTVTLAAGEEIEGSFVYVEITSGTIRLEYDLSVSVPLERLF